MKRSMRTYAARPQDFPMNGRKWLVVDAQDKALGRLAVRVANALRGKDEATFTPHVDTGSFVVVVNAEKVKLTGAKLDQKIYYRHSGHVGNLKSATAREVMNTHPDRVIIGAVAGMLPKNKLGRAVIKKLKVYTGPEHPHAAQNPVPLEV